VCRLPVIVERDQFELGIGMASIGDHLPWRRRIDDVSGVKLGVFRVDRADVVVFRRPCRGWHSPVRAPPCVVDRQLQRLADGHVLVEVGKSWLKRTAIVAEVIASDLGPAKAIEHRDEIALGLIGRVDLVGFGGGN
jgi:hypothetical protein